MDCCQRGFFILTLTIKLTIFILFMIKSTFYTSASYCLAIWLDISFITFQTFSIPITDCFTCGSFTCAKLLFYIFDSNRWLYYLRFFYLYKLQNYYSKPIITLNQQVHRSTDMRLLYLNQGSQFETWLCSCVRYLLGELYRPNSLTWLESELVEVQCSLRILYNLIHQKNYYSKSSAIKVTTNL